MAAEPLDPRDAYCHLLESNSRWYSICARERKKRSNCWGPLSLPSSPTISNPHDEVGHPDWSPLLGRRIYIVQNLPPWSLGGSSEPENCHRYLRVNLHPHPHLWHRRNDASG